MCEGAKLENKLLYWTIDSLFAYIFQGPVWCKQQGQPENNQKNEWEPKKMKLVSPSWEIR